MASFAEIERKEGCGMAWHGMVGGKGGYNSTGAREAVGEGGGGGGEEGRGGGGWGGVYEGEGGGGKEGGGVGCYVYCALSV